MAQYDFTRLSILLVEDSKFMCDLMSSILRAMGIERILIVNNGEEAISIMSPVNKPKDSMVGFSGVDIVISDFFMPVVDGGMFLRWIRLAPKSPDRFLPFIMMSAAADRDIIIKARDAGVDEFLSKPFSATSIMQRLVSVIENQRRIIYCPTYFGPDRRRREKKVDNNRRKMKKEDIEIIYSGKELSSLQNSKKKVWIFKMPRSLKNKLATGSTDKNEPAFDPKMIAAAEKKVADMEGDYSDWVSSSIEELVQAHHRSIEDIENAEDCLVSINRISHELRGQGGIFGYPLITKFGKSLYDCSGERTEITPPLLDLIKAHIDLIKVVMTQKIKGDGGKIGKDLLVNLNEANKKHAAHSKDIKK